MAAPSHTSIAAALHELGRLEAPSPGPHWEDMPELYRAELERMVTETMAGMPVEQQHEGWFADQLLAGWTFGPEYDPVLKTDPRLVHWATYSDDQKTQARKAAYTIQAIYQLAVT
jgi:hypothetical protein